MTRKEIREILNNTKVYVNGKSKDIQKKLFSFGYKWGDNSTEIRFMNEPFLYIRSSLFYHGNNMIDFMDDERKEITANEILSLEVTKPSYRPFKNKDECWHEMQKHSPFGWLYHKDDNSYTPLRICISDVTEFIALFEKLTFADGTPFGIKDS